MEPDVERPNPSWMRLDELGGGSGQRVFEAEISEAVSGPGPRVAVELIQDVRLPIEGAIGGGDEDLRAFLRPLECAIGVVPVEGDALLGAEEMPVRVLDERIRGVHAGRQRKRDGHCR
jgi:hypothetical protein